ncbi:MAG: DUF4185 domain-containing protein [Limisphaerales bacterium]
MKLPGPFLNCALFLGCLGSFLGRASAAPAVPAPDLDALFQRTNGWIGADADYSVALDDRTALWLFGDTLVGAVRDGKRRDTQMINNSIALQSIGSAPRYFYRTNGDGVPASVFTPADANSFFWPWDGVRTARGLFLFLTQVRHTDDKSVWGFQLFSASLAFVSNPDSPPASWKITVTKEPWADFSTSPATAYGWSAVQHQNYVYVYGTAARAAGATVARAPRESLDDFAQWRFYSHGQWQKDPRQATAIFPDKPPEGTVRWWPALGRFVVVYCPDIFGDIVLREAPHPSGPWSERRVIYHCPDSNRSKAYYCYAGKAHPELSRPGELIITYAVNSNDLSDLFNDPLLYWPRFIRLKFPL